MTTIPASSFQAAGFVADARRGAPRCGRRAVAPTRTITCRANSEIPRRALLLTGAAAVVPVLIPAVSPPLALGGTAPSSAYDFVLEQEGKPFPLSYLQDKVTVFVNVASE
ncbi:MAG: hypothetical protein ABGY24_15255 [bacterium]